MTGGNHEAVFRVLGMLPEASRLRMVRMYCDSLGQLMPKLGEAVAAGNATETRTLAHKVAGAAAMMQDQALATATRSMEELLLAGDEAQAYATWPLAETAAAESVEALRCAFL